MIYFGVIIIAAVAAAITIAGKIGRRRRFIPFLSRSCAGRDWRRDFPEADSNDIRIFLRLFVDSFALGQHNYLKYRPGDRLMDIYRAIYPPTMRAFDAMELESFDLLLERQYGTSLESIWRNDLTLGEIFRQTKLI